MKKIFLDIDTQIDFMNPEGALYVKDAKSIVDNLMRLTDYAVNNSIPIISTLDTHTLNDTEFKDFPPHCIHGTKGHKKIEETVVADTLLVNYNDLEYVLEYKYKNWCFLKPSFDAFSNPLFEKFINRFADYEIIIYGVATDYCVKATATGLVERGYKVTIVEDAIKGVSKDTSVKAIRELKDKGVSFQKTLELIQ